MSQYSPKPTGTGHSPKANEPGYSTTPTGSGYSPQSTGSGYSTTPTGAEYSTTHMEPGMEQDMRSRAASPDTLGLGILSFATLILGCYYANFIINSGPLVIRAVGIVLIFGGIVGILAGMWEFRRNSEAAASIFTAYGGFLAVIGFLFLPTGILFPLAVAGTLHLVLGLFYLCWAILAVILSLGAIRTNSILGDAILLFAVAFLFLAIGHLAYDNVPLLRIGGWIAIISGLVGWVGVAFKSLGRVDSIEEKFSPPRDTQERVVQTS